MQCPLCRSENPAGAAICHSCAAPLESANSGSGALPSGTRLHNGAVELLAVLGQGGFGITYYGVATANNAPIAVKEFFPYGCVRQGGEVQPSYTMSADEFESTKQSFFEEARVLSRFQHPNIVRVHAVFSENSTVYMVMEYVAGRTLEEMLEATGVIPIHEAINYIEQVGSALETLHEANLLHRDIKPANIIVHEGRAVLLDFGSARSFLKGATRSMTSLVTPGYAPLEQYGQKARYGTFTDIYALGATLYHLLTGSPPMQATDRASGMELLAPERVNPYISHIISDAILWAMQMRVTERPQTVAAFLRGLKSGDRPAQEALSSVAGHSDVTVTRGQTSSLTGQHDGYASVAQTKKGVTRVALTTRRCIDWPDRCVCCGKGCSTKKRIGNYEVDWEVPYCNPCQYHREQAETIEVVPRLYARMAGMLLGLCLCSSNFRFLETNIIFVLGIFYSIILLASKFWRTQLRRDLRHRDHPNCATLGPAVKFRKRIGDSYLFEFSNKDYANDFIRLNSPQPVTADAVLAEENVPGSGANAMGEPKIGRLSAGPPPAVQ